ncbi:hypothetical protein PMAC_001375 [Pneumocystis sp. 'macacae']|nr:hypothetical protein PMAC_001375 [Pneumocystis sp. 'macacae']
MSCVETLLGHPRSYYDVKMLSGSGDDMPFNIEKAIENLVKSGKPFFWRSPLLSVTHYRSSYSLVGRHSSAYELDHMRSRSTTSTHYTNQSYYNQRFIGHSEQFPLSRRKNKSNNIEQPFFFHGETVKTSVKDNNLGTNDDNIIFSGFSIPPKVLSGYTYDESGLKNWSGSTLQQGLSYQSPFTCFQGNSANLNFVTDRVVNNVVTVDDTLNKNPSFFYRRKSNVVENNENSSLVSSNRIKNIIAPIGTKSSNISLSVDSLNQQTLDVVTSAKPLQHCFSGNGNLIKSDLDDLKCADSSVSMSWDNRIWGDDAKNIGITSNSNGLGLDVLC